MTQEQHEDEQESVTLCDVLEGRARIFRVNKKRKLSWVIVRQLPHDPQYKIGSRIPGYGVVVEVGA